MVALDRYLKWIVLGALFLVPLVPLYVANWAFFPYIVGKGLLFRVLVEVAFGAWLILLLRGAVQRPRLVPMMIAALVFLGVVAVADSLSIAPFKSFWSNFERMEGFVTIAHSVIYFIIAGTMLNTHKLWLRFWQFSLGVSVFVGLSGLAQLGEAARIGGTTGNPIYLAVYALFHIFIALLLMRKDAPLRWVYAALAGYNLIILWFTVTRGAVLGLLAGAFVTALGIVLFGRRTSGMWLYRGALAVIIGAVVLVSSVFVFRSTEFVQNNTLLSRFANISISDSQAHDSSALRLMVWGIAWEGVKERPVIGWGQESFNYVFNKHYNPHMYWAEPWYDRTHNVLLDWLIAAGVLGLISYLALYGAITFEAIRTRYFDGVDTALIVGLLAAYGVHNLFVFDHLISYILFFSVGAWLYAADTKEHQTAQNPLPQWLARAWVQKGGVVVIGVATVVTLYSLNYPLMMQNKTLTKANAASQDPARIEEARQLFVEAASYQSAGTQEVRERFSIAASRIAKIEQIPTEEKQAFVNDALDGLEAQQRTYPQDARYPYFIGTLLTAYGHHAEAELFFKKALELSPTKPSFAINVAINAANRGDAKEAREYLAYATELEESNPAPKALLEQLDAAIGSSQ